MDQPPSAPPPPFQPPPFQPPPFPPPFPPPPMPGPARAPVRVHDPLAIALANASLLSIGYALMRRRLLAACSLLVTAVLVIVLCTVARTEWFEIVLIVWWLAMIVHGWYLTGGRRRTAVARHWVIAAAITVPVLLVVGLVRVDTAGVDRTIMGARGSGDCAQAEAGLNRLWSGHRVIDAPMTARADRTRQACDRVPAQAACDIASIADWLRPRPPTGDARDRTIDAVARSAPTALVECGDVHMAAGEWEIARMRYQHWSVLPSDADVRDAFAGLITRT